jgi:hypothetical protein
MKYNIILNETELKEFQMFKKKQTFWENKYNNLREDLYSEKWKKESFNLYLVVVCVFMFVLLLSLVFSDFCSLGL